jgi:hypothetical protein
MDRKNLFLVPALILSIAGAALANTNFAGKWTVDKTKPGPQGAQIADQTLIIGGAAPRMTVENNLVTVAFGKVSISDSYTTDGKEADFIWKRPNGQEGAGKRTAKWSDDGKKLLITQEALFDAAIGPSTFQLTQTWSLSDDGNTLTIEGVLKVLPFTTLPSKSVFIKVP